MEVIGTFMQKPKQKRERAARRCNKPLRYVRKRNCTILYCIIPKAAESVKETTAAGENESSAGEETIQVTHKRFYIDESGKQCIADTFDGADAFLDGYAVVQKAITGADGKEDVEWGIIKK